MELTGHVVGDGARDRALAYLDSHNVMTLATHGREGLWAASVFYVNDGFKFFFLSALTSRHSLNIEQAPRIAATIQEDYNDWRAIKGIQLEGNASRIEGVEQAAALVLYAKKFPIIAHAPAEIAQALRRIAWYSVRPTRLYLIDNEWGLGHRDEISVE